jgi:hypothetical protein
VKVRARDLSEIRIKGFVTLTSSGLKEVSFFINNVLISLYVLEEYNIYDDMIYILRMGK